MMKIHYSTRAIANGRASGEMFIIVEVLEGNCLGCGAFEFKGATCQYCKRKITNKEAGLL